MSRGRGPQLREADKADVWREWKSGKNLREVAQALSRCVTAIQAVVYPCGGVAPRVRHRSQRALTLAEREEISRGICAELSIRQMAQEMGRAPSSISREINRHGGRLCYRATMADKEAWESACRPKVCLLARKRILARLVAQKLSLNWSPQQISGWLEREYPNDKSMWVSHETIYRSLFIQARGVLKKELTAHLRRGRMYRRGRGNLGGKGDGRGQICDAVSIRERPAQIEDRAVPGHREGDLLAGSGETHIVTLVERRSRFVVLVKVPSSDSQTVVKALARRVCRLPKQLRRSLTWDRGKEMARHKSFSVATDVQVYFCDPSSPWQRGTNENTNGLLRQYFPKKTDLSHYSQADLDKVALQLNQRPRATLGFQTPADKLNSTVASTG